MSPRAPAAVTILPARRSARAMASATEVSSASRSAPRSQRVGAGTGPRARRAVSAASSVVRPVPGAPTRPRTTAGPSGAVAARSGDSKAVSSATTSGRSTGSGQADGPSEEPSEVAVRCRAPARLRSRPYPGTLVALRRSSASSGPPVPAAHSGTANAPGCPARSALPSTAMTAPLSGSRTGPPTAAPPSRRASLPSVPSASSSAAPIRWERPCAVYVTGAVPSTRASRQPCAAIVTYVPASIRSRRAIATGSTPSSPGPSGGQQREVQLGQRGDVPGLDGAAAAARSVQDGPGEAGHGFVAGQDRAPVVRDEPGPPRLGFLPDRRYVPALSGPRFPWSDVRPDDQRVDHSE